MRWILFFPAFFSLTVSAQTVEDLIIKDQGKQTTAGTMIRIAVQKDPLKVVTLPLEEYIQGVLQGEIPTDWPLEALKAQAVTARTYTLYRISHPANEEYDLETTVEDQVYKKSDEIPPSVQKAVQETAGEVLKKRGEIIPAFYHSCCGGITEDPAIIWGGPSLKSVRDPNCLSCPNRSWEVEIGKERLREVLSDFLTKKGAPLTGSWSLKVKERSHTGRVMTLSIMTEKGEFSISSFQLRRSLGYSQIKSNWYELKEGRGAYRFRGRGFGHGAGLCQWGAKGMADLGFSYREILKFYYPQEAVEKIKFELILTP